MILITLYGRGHCGGISLFFKSYIPLRFYARVQFKRFDLRLHMQFVVFASGLKGSIQGVVLLNLSQSLILCGSPTILALKKLLKKVVFKLILHLSQSLILCGSPTISGSIGSIFIGGYVYIYIYLFVLFLYFFLYFFIIIFLIYILNTTYTTKIFDNTSIYAVLQQKVVLIANTTFFAVFCCFFTNCYIYYVKYMFFLI